MDAEDLAELDARKELRTNSEFASAEAPSSTSAMRLESRYDPLTGDIGVDPNSSQLHQLVGPSKGEAAFSDLIQPSNARVGRRLMQKMGWREGQGIGPRITFARKQRSSNNIGVPITTMDEEDDPERQKHLFPPLDRPLVLFQPWSGNSGLGYSKSNHSVQLDRSFGGVGLHATSEIGPAIDGQIMPHGASFGLGALNDLEDDDQDIYDSETNQISNDPRARRLLVLDDEPTALHSSSTSRSHPHRPHQQQPVPSVLTFSDGTKIPKGFRLSTGSASSSRGRDTWYKAPVIPDGWEPSPSQVWQNGLKQPSAASHEHTSRETSKPITANDVSLLKYQHRLPLLTNVVARQAFG